MHTAKTCISWNMGKLTDLKPPLKLKEIWEIRIHCNLIRLTKDQHTREQKNIPTLQVLTK